MELKNVLVMMKNVSSCSQKSFYLKTFYNSQPNFLSLIDEQPLSIIVLSELSIF